MTTEESTEGSVEEIVVGALAEVLDCDPNTLSLQCSLADLGVNSVTLLAIAVHIEGVTGVHFEGTQIVSLYAVNTVAGMIEAVRGMLEAPGEREEPT